MILFKDEQKIAYPPLDIEDNSTNTNDNNKIEDNKVYPAITLLPIEIGTLLFAAYRISFNVYYLITINPIWYFWIGRITEIILCIAAFILHTYYLKNWGEFILSVSNNHCGYTMFYHIFGILSYSYTLSQQYLNLPITNFYFSAGVASILWTITMASSYHFFKKAARIDVEDIVFDSLRWFPDLPLFIFNSFIQFFLWWEQDIWVSVWVADFIYHTYEIIVYLYEKYQK